MSRSRFQQLLENRVIQRQAAIAVDRSVEIVGLPQHLFGQCSAATLGIRQ
ncbi:hypothetical protein ACS8Y6_09685 [Salinisphaera sp. RV14]